MTIRLYQLYDFISLYSFLPHAYVIYYQTCNLYCNKCCILQQDFVSSMISYILEIYSCNLTVLSFIVFFIAVKLPLNHVHCYSIAVFLTVSDMTISISCERFTENKGHTYIHTLEIGILINYKLCKNNLTYRKET